MKIVLILLIAATIVAAISYGIANYLVYVILDRNGKHKESTDVLSKDPEEVIRGIQLLCGREEWRNEFAEKCETWSLESKDALCLKAKFIKADTHNYAIVCHGFTGRYTEVLGRAEHFYRKGFSVLTPDARAHGESEGQYRGMGWLEIEDIKLWINKIIEHDPVAKIILFGQSMGAATVINVSGEELPKNVKLVIEDCSYTSVWDEFAGQIGVRYHLPAFPIMHLADIICIKKAGYSFREASPLNQISKCKLPILLIHGGEDSFVPCEFVHQLYEKAKEPKEKLVIEGAGHCMSVARNEKLYWETVDSFIERYF